MHCAKNGPITHITAVSLEEEVYLYNINAKMGNMLNIEEMENAAIGVNLGGWKNQNPLFILVNKSPS